MTDVQISADPKEISVGGITQVIANVLPANATDKKITYTTSNAAVAEVNAETGVVTGMGEGTAIITASSSNGKKATVEITVTDVKVTEIQISANSANVGVDGFIDLTAKVLPENASIKKLDWTSDRVDVATVDGNGRVKGIAVGKAMITATATDGSGVKTEYEINVVTSDEMDIELTNPYQENGQNVDVSGNTVLYGKPMNIRVQVRKNGQPTQNAHVVLKAEKLAPENEWLEHYSIPTAGYYESTDNEGYANFTFAWNSQAVVDHYYPEKIKASDINAISDKASAEVYKLTATDSASGMSKEIIVNTAVIKADCIEIVNKENVKSYTDTTFKTTYGDRKQEYVVEQNVSPKGLSKNSVEFTTNAHMEYGLTEEGEESEPDWTPNLSNSTAGTYSVYNRIDNTTTTTYSAEIPKGIEYLTLNFAKIVLSKYTRIDVDYQEKIKEGQYQTIPGLKQVITADNNTDNKSELSIQIGKGEISEHEGRLVVSVVTQGRISTEETGYVLKSLKGRWKDKEDSQIKENPLPDGNSVEWDVVSDSDIGREQKKFEAGKTINGIGDVSNALYTVPVFPYTGDAYITTKDGLYAYPTKANDENVNVIADDYIGNAFKITDDEATHVVTEGLTKKGNNAVVNATETGRMQLKATLNISALNDGDFNFHNGKELYTSIQWSPVSSETESQENDYYAVEAQRVRIRAQLCDINGNKKTDPSKAIKFTFADKAGNLIELDKSKNVNEPLSNDFNIENQTNDNVVLASPIVDTDSNGRVEFDLLGDGVAAVRNLRASCDGYTVDLSIVRNNTELAKINNGANIYWVDFGLKFKESALVDGVYNPDEWLQGDENFDRDLTQYDATVKEIPVAKGIESVVNQPWKVGYKMDAHAVNKNGNDKSIIMENAPHIVYTLSSNETIRDINGKTYTISKNSISTYLSPDEDVVEIRSQRNFKEMRLIGTIKAENLDNIIFKVKEGDKVNDEPHQNVGYGPSLTLGGTGLSLPIKWKASGLDVKVTPENPTVSLNGTTKLTVKVSDAYGNINNEEKPKVSYTIDGLNKQDIVLDDNGTVEFDISGNKIAANGRSFIEVVAESSEGSRTVTLVVNRTDQ